MTVEQIELRKILTQMLADNGINRETIKGFVEEIVSEKVDRAIDRIIHETNMDSLVRTTIQNTINRTSCLWPWPSISALILFGS